MRASDAALLDWIFSTGISAFERSTMGFALERAELFAMPRAANAPEVTARPIHSRQHEPSQEPDEAAMRKAGGVWRRLLKVPAAHRDVLERWHGVEGAKWARHERGRVVALFPVVPSGAELVLRARRHAVNRLELSDADRLRVEVELDAVRKSGDDMRRRLIVLATREGLALYDEAIASWVEAG